MKSIFFLISPWFNLESLIFHFYFDIFNDKFIIFFFVTLAEYKRLKKKSKTPENWRLRGRMWDFHRCRKMRTKILRMVVKKNSMNILIGDLKDHSSNHLVIHTVTKFFFRSCSTNATNVFQVCTLFNSFFRLF